LSLPATTRDIFEAVQDQAAGAPGMILTPTRTLAGSDRMLRGSRD
jgi:hypothetical protein